MQKGPTIVYKIWIAILDQRYVKHIKGVVKYLTVILVSNVAHGCLLVTVS